VGFTDSERADLLVAQAHGISPREYGRLEAKVDSLEDKVDSLETKVDTLLELANRGRGGLWVGMGIASLGGGMLTWITQKLLER